MKPTEQQPSLNPMDRYDFKHNGEQWTLTKQGASRAALVFGDKTKEEAIKQAAKYMEEHPGSMRIHKLNGTYEEERTYPRNADPRQSPG
jgi:hypothetical protein